MLTSRKFETVNVISHPVRCCSENMFALFLYGKGVLRFQDIGQISLPHHLIEVRTAQWEDTVPTE